MTDLKQKWEEMILDYKRVLLINLQEMVVAFRICLCLAHAKHMHAILALGESILSPHEEHSPFNLYGHSLVVIW